MMGLCYAISGSIFTTTSTALEQEYGISYTVSTLGVALFNFVSKTSLIVRKMY